MAKLMQIDGKPILDAKRPITIQIIPNDVSKASRKDPADCVLARACRRSLHAKEVRIHMSRVYLRANDGSWTRYIVPPRLKQEIIAFDRGGSFATDQFYLYAPNPAHKGGKAQGTETGRNKKSGQKRRNYIRVQDVRVGPA